MIEYKILIPVRDNEGASTLAARNAFQDFCFDYAGGFTLACEVLGYWRGKNGKVYHDNSIPVYIATDAAIDGLVAKWFECFPDQEACYYTAGPYAFIVARPADRSIDGGTVALDAGRHDRGWRK